MPVRLVTPPLQCILHVDASGISASFAQLCFTGASARPTQDSESSCGWSIQVTVPDTKGFRVTASGAYQMSLEDAVSAAYRVQRITQSLHSKSAALACRRGYHGMGQLPYHARPRSNIPPSSTSRHVYARACLWSSVDAGQLCVRFRAAPASHMAASHTASPAPATSCVRCARFRAAILSKRSSWSGARLEVARRALDIQWAPR
jgi:hypothetical protein